MNRFTSELWRDRVCHSVISSATDSLETPVCSNKDCGVNHPPPVCLLAVVPIPDHAGIHGYPLRVIHQIHSTHSE